MSENQGLLDWDTHTEIPTFEKVGMIYPKVWLRYPIFTPKWNGSDIYTPYCYTQKRDYFNDKIGYLGPTDSKYRKKVGINVRPL